MGWYRTSIHVRPRAAEREMAAGRVPCKRDNRLHAACATHITVLFPMHLAGGPTHEDAAVFDTGDEESDEATKRHQAQNSGASNAAMSPSVLERQG